MTGSGPTATGTSRPGVVPPRHAAAPVVDRDRQTVERLAAALARHGPFRISGFDPHWWDGAAYSPCLLADTGGTPARVIETQGQVLVLPSRVAAARRALARWRAGTEPLPVLPGPDSADYDVVSCHYIGCGGLILVPPPGIDAAEPVCPLCGRR